MWSKCAGKFCQQKQFISSRQISKRGHRQASGVTPIGQGWTNARGLRGPKPDPILYILIFQVLAVSHLFYSTTDLFVNVLRPSSSYNV